jgi:hypothetical protein
VDHRLKFRTDVIEVGQPELACGGGAPLAAGFEDGSITLIFRNRAQSGSDAWYLLTCAHVASDLVDSPPSEPSLQGPSCVAVESFAQTLKNSLPDRKRLDYDIALARITAEARNELGADGLAALDGRVSDDGARLTGYLDPAEIRPALEIGCQSGVSGASEGRLSWGPGRVDVRLDGSWLHLDDVYMTDIAAQPGDSGGIVFSQDQAVGVLFARSDAGRAWLQPLEPAVQHLAGLDPAFALDVF